MSTWLDFAEFSDEISDEEVPYHGIYTMKPNEIAAVLPRPMTPFINKQIFSPQTTILSTEDIQNEKLHTFDIKIKQTSRILF